MTAALWALKRIFKWVLLGADTAAVVYLFARVDGHWTVKALIILATLCALMTTLCVGWKKPIRSGSVDHGWDIAAGQPETHQFYDVLFLPAYLFNVIAVALYLWA